MAEEPTKAGSTGETEVKPVPSATRAEPAATTTETPEQRIARLEAENEAFRKTQPEWQRKVGEANRILEESKARGTQPPPTTPPADPLDAEISRAASELDQVDQALREWPSDPGYRAARRVALADLQVAQAQKLVRQVTPEFNAMPEAYRARAWELWGSSRGMISPAVALAAARGEKGPDDDAVAKLNQELAETRKDLKASKAGVFAGGGVPPGAGAPVLEPKPSRVLADGTRVYPRSEWAKLDSLPRDEKLKLLRDYKQGKVLTE